MTTATQLWLRKLSLFTVASDKALDLSEMRFQFQTQQADTETPNNCSIRVFNLKDTTALSVRKEFSRVVLQAGYAGCYGTIFDGTIKQVRVGRESAASTYLDILAADGDLGYNFGVVNKTFAAGSTPNQHLAEAAKVMGLGIGFVPDLTGVSPSIARGKVAFGMARDLARTAASTVGATWSIQDGKLQVLPLTGYLPGEAVVLDSASGLLGVPEQTELGIRATCLLNPKIRVGGLVKIDNKSVNQIFQQRPDDPTVFNQWKGIQFAARVSEDGLYRVYVAEHRGDTRGNDWTSELTCLSVNRVSNLVEATQ